MCYFLQKEKDLRKSRLEAFPFRAPRTGVRGQKYFEIWFFTKFSRAQIFSASRGCAATQKNILEGSCPWLSHVNVLSGNEKLAYPSTTRIWIWKLNFSTCFGIQLVCFAAIDDERMSHIGTSFSAVCSPPISLMYKGRKRSSSKLKKMENDVEDGDALDEDIWAGLLKISKSSEELWKDVYAVSLLLSTLTLFSPQHYTTALLLWPWTLVRTD